MKFIKVLIVILLFFVGLMFFIQNYEVLDKSMALRFNVFIASWKTIELPFYFLLLVFFLIGALFTLSYFLFEKIRIGSELRKCRSRAGRLEKELNSLRNLPLETGVEPEAKAKKDKSKGKDKDKGKKDKAPEVPPAPVKDTAFAAPAGAPMDEPAADERPSFSADFLTGSGSGEEPDKS